MMKRKASRSAAEWAEIVREYRESGESEAEFCARKDVTASTLRKWRSAPAGRGRSKSRTATSGFVRVSTTPSTPSDGVTIDVGGGVRIECPATMSVSAIAALVREVRDGR
jgi:hypothetical protein